MSSLKPPGTNEITSTDNSYTPDFTPSSTPSREPRATPLENEVMGDSKTEDQSPIDDEQAEEVKDEKLKAPKEAIPATDTKKSQTKKAKKQTCKKHGKALNRTKSKGDKDGSSSSSSDSPSSSSSSSDGDSDSENEQSDSSDSSSSEDEKIAKKQKKKAKRKLQKKKSKKKTRKAASSSSEGSSSDESSSSDDGGRLRRKLKKKDKSRRVEHTEEEYDDEEEEDEASSAELARQRRQQLLQRGQTLKQLGRRQMGSSKDKSKKKGKKSKKTKKSPTKPQFFRADELWDRQIHAYKLQETAATVDDDEYGEYIFHVRRRFDWEGKYADTVVDIKSKTLRNALQTIMGNCKAVSLAEETPVIDPNMLFLYLEDIRKHYRQVKAKVKSEKKKKARKVAADQAAHLKVLVKYLDKDYAITKKALYPLLEAGNITFDLLWTLFRSDTIIYTSTYSAPDEPRAFKVEYATKENSFMKGTWYDIEGRYMDFDGKNFGLGTMNVEIESFKGPRRITSLPCYPVKYHKDPELIQKQLVERGKKFVSLAGMKYKSHVGLGFMKRKRQVLKVSTNSRVMLDPSTFRRINPNYPISTVKTQDPDLLPENEDDEDGECSCCEDCDIMDTNEPLADADQPRYRLKLVIDKDDNPHIIEVEVDENGNELKKESVVKLPNGDDGTIKREFTEEELLISSPVILGFAFSEKLWLEFTVSGINDIEWNEGAFDSLVLPDNQKSIVKALVQSHTSEAQERKTIDDVIKGKGKGLVAVLHGSPGVGKTLTAEGIAELLKCPLYSVSAGELGTNPRELEQELTKILDVAHSWGAVLLLDEADVFLEARTAQDIHRNALVSIFLRVLEYFQGILFLTTNRVSSFDDAFQSRIHVALRYQELDFKARRAIFKMFIDRVAATSDPKSTVYSNSASPASTLSTTVESVSVSGADKTATKVQNPTPTAATTEPSANCTTSEPSSSSDSSSAISTPSLAATPVPAVVTFSEADFDRLARKGNLNGRQIKNAVRSAQALAVNEKKPLSMAHIMKVLDVAEAFERDLKGGSGYLDAMRSYT